MIGEVTAGAAPGISAKGATGTEIAAGQSRDFNALLTLLLHSTLLHYLTIVGGSVTVCTSTPTLTTGAAAPGTATSTPPAISAGTVAVGWCIRF